MFCINCGKQILDTARFCNYCGIKIVNFDENPVQNSVETTENPVSVPAGSVNFSDNVENSVDLLKMNSSASPSIPQMNEPPKSGEAPFNGGAAAFGSPEIRTGAVGAQHSTVFVNEPAPYAAQPPYMRYGANIPPSAPAVSSQPEQPKRQPERRYTLGHIIMCLASTAVMAIVAGVFAGLYFSVV